MTIIRQFAVSDNTSRKRLRDFFNHDESILLRDSNFLPLFDATQTEYLEKWDRHMEATRRAYGHDTPSRHIRDKVTRKLVPAKNTIMYHQTLNFLADECDINGGKLTPEDCLRYAGEYAATYYADYEYVLAVQKVTSKDDDVSRYVVHVIINRTDLKTGKRLNEGRADTIAKVHARHIRAMDELWGLRVVEKGKQNSVIHSKQNRPHRKSRSAAN